MEIPPRVIYLLHRRSQAWSSVEAIERILRGAVVAHPISAALHFSALARGDAAAAFIDSPSPPNANPVIWA